MAGGRGRDAVRLLLAWVLIVGVVIAVGFALTGPLHTSVGVADNNLERSLASHRTAGLTDGAQAVSLMGETVTQVILVPVLLIGTWLVLRLTRPVVFLAVAAAGEIAAYLVTVSIISRPRPPVRLLDPGLEPLHSYPSGHVAAAMATYGGLAVLTWTYGGDRRRWLSGLLALAPPLVAVGRLYLGVHHPTDVLVSLAFMSAWLATAGAILLQPPSRSAVEIGLDRTRQPPTAME
jgi:membrane-associated phospholipid phosphatase